MKNEKKSVFTDYMDACSNLASDHQAVVIGSNVFLVGVLCFVYLLGKKRGAKNACRYPFA